MRFLEDYMRKIVLLILCLLPAVLYAQLPSITAKVSNDYILVGDQIRYSLIINYDPEVFAIGIPPITNELLSPFTIIAEEGCDTSISNHNVQLTKSYIITCYDSGSYNLAVPNLNVLYDATAQRVPPIVPAIEVYVNNVPVNLRGDIKAIKEASFSKSLRELTNLKNVAIVLIPVLLLAYLLYRLWRKLRKKKVSPYEQCMASLESIGKISNATAAQQYDVLVAAIKQYITQRYSVPVQYQTSSKAIASLQTQAFWARYAPFLQQVFADADMVKFAHEQRDTEHVHKQVMQLIETVKLAEQNIIAIEQAQQQSQKGGKRS
jgi:hypothetical protein